MDIDRSYLDSTYVKFIFKLHVFRVIGRILKVFELYSSGEKSKTIGRGGRPDISGLNEKPEK